MGLPYFVEPRAAIKFCVRLGYSASRTSEELQKTGLTPEMKRSAVFKWHKRFKDGRQSIEDDERTGRPTKTDVKLAAPVKSLVERDRRLKIRDISEAVGASYRTVHTILVEKLNRRHLCARWVPKILKKKQKEKRVSVSKQFVRNVSRDHDFLNRIIFDETWLYLYDSENKEQSKQWTTRGSPSPTKVLTSRCSKKFMFVMFADIRGMLLCHTVPPPCTVNSEYYSKILRRDLVQAIKKKRPGTSLSDYLLHHDNAPAHVSQVTRLEMDLMELRTVQHPPYSPDLAPMDFALFPKVKAQLRGDHVQDLAELNQ